MNKYVVYTAIFGRYDVLKNPIFKNPLIDYICFTDNKKLKSKIWKIIYYNNEEFNSSKKNRYLKILAPYLYLNNYQISIYIDGSLLIKNDLIDIFRKYQYYDFVCFRHPKRDCVFEEIEQCLIEGRGDKVSLFRQGLAYIQENMPYHFSLSLNGVLFRNHNSKIIEKVMYECWAELKKYSGRDQICLPYVLWKNNLEYTFFDEDIMNSKHIEWGPHRLEYKRRVWRFFKKYF